MNHRHTTLLRLAPELIASILNYLTPFQMVGFSQTCKLALQYSNRRVRLQIPRTREGEGAQSEMKHYIQAFRYWIFKIGPPQRISMRVLIVMPAVDLCCAISTETITLYRSIMNACVLAVRGDEAAFDSAVQNVKSAAKKAGVSEPLLGDARMRCHAEACREYKTKADECSNRGETSWFELFVHRAEASAAKAELPKPDFDSARIRCLVKEAAQALEQYQM